MVITDVAPGSPAAEAGLQPDDVILEVNHQAVKSAADVRARREEPPGRPTLLLVSRDGAQHLRRHSGEGNRFFRRDSLDLMTWLVWSLLSAVFAALTAILAKKGVAGVDANLATAVRTSVVVVFTWLLAFLTRGRPRLSQNFTSKTWVFLALSGMATGLSWLCYFRALQVGEASRVAPIDKLSVVFVILAAAVFLGEKLTLGKGVGVVLIAAGAIAIALD